MSELTQSRLERRVTAPSGLVVMLRIVESDGSFAPVSAYTTNERTHVWRRDDGESLEAFESRVVNETEWLAVRRGRAVGLVPLE
jgi:hypothetical protein